LDNVEESALLLVLPVVEPLFDNVELLSAQEDGVLLWLVLLPEVELLVSVLGLEVWAIVMPLARAAATARVVSVFLVAFISVLLEIRRPENREQLQGWKKNAGEVPAGFQLRPGVASTEWVDCGSACRTRAVTTCVAAAESRNRVRRRRSFLSPPLDLQGRVGAFAAQRQVFIQGQPAGRRVHQRRRGTGAMGNRGLLGLLRHECSRFYRMSHSLTLRQRGLSAKRA
jgi:hypothetical protein